MEKADARALLVGAKINFLNNTEMMNALTLGIEAIDKQRAKKVLWKEGRTYTCPPDCGGAEFDEYGELAYCPSCEHKFSTSETNYKFCNKCGQKLDWSKEGINYQE